MTMEEPVMESPDKSPAKGKGRKMLIPTLIMAVLAITLFAIGYFGGEGKHIDGLKESWKLTGSVFFMLVFAIQVRIAHLRVVTELYESRNTERPQWVVSRPTATRALGDRYALQTRPSDQEFQFSRLNGSFCARNRLSKRAFLRR